MIKKRFIQMMIWSFFAVIALLIHGFAFAEPVTSGSDKASLTLYGQINRAMLYANDGDESYVFHVDNDNSSTRFGFRAKAVGGEKLTIGAKFEVEIQSNASNNVSQGNSNEGGTNFRERHMDIYFEFPYGKLSLGQGDTASNGTSEVDLSGTTVIGYSGIADMAGGMKFYDKDAESATGPQIKSVFDNLDGNSRKDRLRYDTPNFAGFVASVSTFAQDIKEDDGKDKTAAAWDIAVNWSGQFGDVKTAAAIAYSVYPDDDNPDIDEVAPEENLVNGSISAIWQGFNLTFAAGNLKLDEDKTVDDRDSSDFWYGKIGYIRNFWGIGDTAFAVDYTQANDFDQKDDEAKSWGLLFNQMLPNWSAEIYAAYRFHELDRDDASFDDISTFMLGTRIKF